MAIPAIDPESSILSYPQWLTWEHQFSATNLPTSWQIVAGGFPSGITFEPSWSVTGDATANTIALTAHGFANGTILVFSALTGGAGLSTATRYYVVGAATDTFQLAATLGGAAIDFTTAITAATLFRPGFLGGAATLPGICTVQLTATNGDGASTPPTLFTIGIEPAAAVPDSNTDLVWDFATNNIIAQTSSTLSLTPPSDPTVPILFVKEQDDLIVRLRLVKGGSVLSPTVTACNLVLKELEPENQIVISDAFATPGSGDSFSVLIHAKFDGAALAAALSNYEADAGTFFPALAEIELTFNNDFGVGPGSLVRTSKTFRIQIDRDLGETA